MLVALLDRRRWATILVKGNPFTALCCRTAEPALDQECVSVPLLAVILVRSCRCFVKEAAALPRRKKRCFEMVSSALAGERKRIREITPALDPLHGQAAVQHPGQRCGRRLDDL